MRNEKIIDVLKVINSKLGDLAGRVSEMVSGGKPESTANKVTSISSESTDAQYPSAKAVYTAIQEGGGGGSSFTIPQINPDFESIVFDGGWDNVILWGDDQLSKEEFALCLGITTDQLDYIVNNDSPFLISHYVSDEDGADGYCLQQLDERIEITRNNIRCKNFSYIGNATLGLMFSTDGTHFAKWLPAAPSDNQGGGGLA